MNNLPSYTLEPTSGCANTSGTHYVFALRNLILKDFKVRYRNMSLGVLWSVINPLVMLGVMVIVFSFIYPHHHNHSFPVFLLIGLIVYNFMGMAIPPATCCIIDNANLVKRVIFPRELIPLSVVLSQLVHLGIQLLLLFGFMAMFAIRPGWAWLWSIPILLVLLIFMAGLAFACAALHVVYRDMLYVVESALKVLFWLTPVFYDLHQVKVNLSAPLYLVYLLNPMAGCIDALRRAFLHLAPPDLLSISIALLVAVLTLLAGWLAFRRRQRDFADYL